MQWMILLMMVSAAAGETTISESIVDPGAAWPAELGGHRAVVGVSGPADAVWVHLPW